MYRLAVLLSGRGSNFEAILNAIKNGYIKKGEIVVVVSNKSDARGLSVAKKNGLSAVFVDSKGKDREEYDREIVDILKRYATDYVLLAGYMRILSPYFIRNFKNRILNIHPALLPSFKGLNAQKQAIEKGVRFSGATVHFVTENLDDGPIIVQSVVPVYSSDNEDSLSERILRTEHKIYPLAVKLLTENRIKIDKGKVFVDWNEVEDFYITNPKIGGEDGV